MGGRSGVGMVVYAVASAHPTGCDAEESGGGGDDDDERGGPAEMPCHYRVFFLACQWMPPSWDPRQTAPLTLYSSSGLEEEQ
jgi:hypothetical protein